MLNRATLDENPEEEGVTFTPPTNKPPSPIYVPTAQFSSPEGSEDESIEEMKATTHTTMEVKTIDALNSGNVNLICSERATLLPITNFLYFTLLLLLFFNCK